VPVIANFGIHWFRFSDIDQLPDRPGIYAWYYLPKMDSNKLNKASKEEKPDIAEEKIRIIQKNFERPAKWHLGNDFGGLNNPMRGKSGSDILPRLVGTLRHDNLIHKTPRDKIRNNPDYIIEFNKLVEKIGPFFFSPIYIGKTMQEGGIRHRVSTHRQQFLEKRSQITELSNPKKNQEEKDNVESFSKLGERMALLDLKQDYLWVAGFPIDTAEGSNSDREGFITFIEGFLNRLVHPIHGEK
jgi:hypothetical protein